MDKKEQLNGLIEKAKKGVTARKEASKIISEIFLEEKDYGYLANILLKFHYSVTEIFFETNQFSDEEIEKILKAMTENKTYIKNEIKFHFNKSFIICSILLKHNYSEKTILYLVDFILNNAERKEGFPDKLTTNFNIYIGSKGLTERFCALAEAYDNDKAKKKFIRFVSQPTKKTDSLINENKREAPKSENNNDDKSAGNDIKHKKTENKKPQHSNNEIFELASKILTKLSEDKISDMEESFRKSVELQSFATESYKAENEKLKTEISELKKQFNVLSIQNSEYKEKISSLISSNSDLEKRLKTIMEMDETSKNQELESLKKRISDSLKNEYYEFTEGGKEFSEDNFYANYTSIQRIFKILNRFGINFD